MTKKKAAPKKETAKRNSPAAPGCYARKGWYKATALGKTINGHFKTLAEAIKARAAFLAEQESLAAKDKKRPAAKKAVTK